MNAPHPIAAELRRRRIDLDLTQAAVARRVRQALHSGTTDRIISAWELGTMVPKFDSAAAWAGALGYDITLRPAVKP